MSEPFRKDSAGYVANQKVFLTADGKLVQDGDHRATQLLAVKGALLSEKLGKRFSLDKAKLEPLEKGTGIKHGFSLSNSGFNNPPKVATIDPEEISARSTRPETPRQTR